jgi:carbamoyl-phosphate synthase large subunit
LQSPFLVTGANGDIADAIARILGEAYPEVLRFGTDMAGASKWPGRRNFAEVYPLPPAHDAGYAAALHKLAKEIAPSLIILSTEQELKAAAQHAEAFAGLPVLANAGGLVLNFLDKLQTARWLAEAGVPGPRTYPLDEAGPQNLPLMVKPRVGRGSRGLEIVRTPERLNVVQDERSDEAIAQELLEAADAEFTCALFKWDGELRTLQMRRRLIGGMTGWIKVEQDTAVQRMLEAVAAALPARAVVNVQLRLTASGPRIFEINPRISGTAMMRHRIGFTDVVWWIDALKGKSHSYETIPVGTEVYRTYGEFVPPRDAG